MIPRLVLASLRRRPRQLALIMAAVLVAAATVATLAGFSQRAGQRLGAGLAAFGPNLVVRPQVGIAGGLPADAAERLRRVPGVLAVTAIAAGGGDAVADAGVAGANRAADGQGSAGSTGAAASPGAGGAQNSAAGAGGSLLASAAGAGERSPVPLQRLDVRADPARLEAVARAIEARVEGVEASPLLKSSASDAAVTRRLTLVLVAVSGVSFLLALLSVGAATAALLGERRVEVGLMLALGYEGRRVGAMLAAELLTAALLAALAGDLLGEIAAGNLARRLLGGSGGVALTGTGLAAAAAVAVLVVGASLAVALARIERLDAARVLRGG